MINLILCGGSGTRLWPISRTLLPKQFVPLFQFLIASNQEAFLHIPLEAIPADSIDYAVMEKSQHVKVGEEDDIIRFEDKYGRQ